MDCVVILNGDKPKLNKRFFDGKYVICADGAYSYAKAFGIKVDLLLGDFDSLDEIPKDINIRRYNSDKDYTDGELALSEAINKQAETITMIGVSGGRDDHCFANITLLYKALKNGIRAIVKTDFAEYFMFDSNVTERVKKGYYFSIVPFSETLHILNTEGLKYKITDKTLYLGETLGISNITTEDVVKIEVEGGCGIAFITDEKAK